MKYLKNITAIFVALTILASPHTNMDHVKAYVEEVKNADGTYTYTDSDTGESINSKWQDSYARELVCKELSTWTIETKSYTNVINLDTPMDVAKFDNFRSNNESLKIKVMYRKESNYGKTWYGSNYLYVDTPDGQKIFKDIHGNRKNRQNALEDIWKTNKYEAYGIYKIRLYTNKTGKYEFSYDALDHDGNVIATKTIHVVAKKDGDPIKEATFAGRRFYESNARLQAGIKTNLYKGKNATWSIKSGKIKIKMNKGYKLKKLELGYRGLVRDEGSTNDKWSNSLANISWKTIKNGKKIKLYTNDTNPAFDSYEKKQNPNAPGGYDIYKDVNKGSYASTYIRVTYFDKANGSTERVELHLITRIK